MMPSQWLFRYICVQLCTIDWTGAMSLNKVDSKLTETSTIVWYTMDHRTPRPVQDKNRLCPPNLNKRWLHFLDAFARAFGKETALSVYEIFVPEMRILLAGFCSKIEMHCLTSICSSYGSLDYNTHKSTILCLGCMSHMHAINDLFSPCAHL